MDQQAIVLFDGVCNLCNSFVQFVLKHDRHNHFVFASLQSKAGEKLLAKHAIERELKTILLIESDKVYVRSAAVLRICRRLSGWWPGFYFLTIVPRFIRDACYNKIAHNRYRWFGKRKECLLPTPEQQLKFLNNETDF